MNIIEYQDKIKEFAVYPEANTGEFVEIVYLMLGLNGESGKAAEKLKKLIRDFDSENGWEDERVIAFKEDLIKELGDVLWYLTQSSSWLDLSLEELAEYNFNKLASRQQRGVIKGSGDDR